MINFQSSHKHFKFRKKKSYFQILNTTSNMSDLLLIWSKANIKLGMQSPHLSHTWEWETFSL